MAYLEWDWDWKEKKEGGKSGTYRSGSTGLQTEEDVRRYVASVHPKLECTGVRLVGEGTEKTTPQVIVPVKPIDPNHILHGSTAETKAAVREFTKGTRQPQ